LVHMPLLVAAHRQRRPLELLLGSYRPRYCAIYSSLCPLSTCFSCPVLVSSLVLLVTTSLQVLGGILSAAILHSHQDKQPTLAGFIRVVGSSSPRLRAILTSVLHFWTRPFLLAAFYWYQNRRVWGSVDHSTSRLLAPVCFVPLWCVAASFICRRRAALKTSVFAPRLIGLFSLCVFSGLRVLGLGV
jgi:hypothetical protein